MARLASAAATESRRGLCGYRSLAYTYISHYAKNAVRPILTLSGVTRG